MSVFIPTSKLLKLREAAKNGDEAARKILMAQLNDEDFSADLESYFKPKEEKIDDEPIAEESIQEESIEETANAPQEEMATEEVAPENPETNEISDGILALIASCDKKTIEVANNSDISDATKKGALSILQEIKQNCLENLEKFGKLMSSLTKKPIEEEE